MKPRKKRRSHLRNEATNVNKIDHSILLFCSTKSSSYRESLSSRPTHSCSNTPSASSSPSLPSFFLSCLLGELFPLLTGAKVRPVAPWWEEAKRARPQLTVFGNLLQRCALRAHPRTKAVSQEGDLARDPRIDRESGSIFWAAQEARQKQTIIIKTWILFEDGQIQPLGNTLIAVYPERATFLRSVRHNFCLNALR